MLHVLVEARIAVGEVLERQVEGRAERSIEGRRTPRVGDHRPICGILDGDVVSGAPPAHVPGEDHVRGEAVAHAHELLGEARRVLRKSIGDDRRNARSVAAGRGLLDVAPEVGLDVQHHRRRPCRAAEERLGIGPVGLHRPRIPQVREVGVRLVASARLRLQQLVEGEDRDQARSPRLAHVARDERAVGVPGRPARAGVDPAGEVLVTEAEGRARTQRPCAAGCVREPDLQRLRPAMRQGRKGGGPRGRRAHDRQQGNETDATQPPCERPHPDEPSVRDHSRRFRTTARGRCAPNRGVCSAGVPAPARSRGTGSRCRARTGARR